MTSAQQTSQNASAPVAIACAGCGKLHEFPQMSAVVQVWCSGCGELIEAKDGVRRKSPMPEVRDRPAPTSTPVATALRKRLLRPISVHVALLAGGLAVFMEILALLASLVATWPAPFLVVRLLLNPWWIFLLVWGGLIIRSQRAARCAIVGGVFFAFLLCSIALQQQIAAWGVNPPWSELFWGTVRVMLRSLPLLIMVAALGTRSARDYFHNSEWK